MASTGEVFPTNGTTTSEAPWSDDAWVSPTNIFSNNATNTSVTASTYDSGDQSQVLKGFTFDFSSIPAGSIIDGVVVKVEAREAAGSAEIDLVQLLDVSRAKVGTNLAATPVAVTATMAVYTFGTSTNLWGNALTDTWVKDADFGVAVGMIATAANTDVEIDYISMEVFYHEPAPTLDQDAFRFYEDGSESGSVAIAAQDTDITRNVSSNSNLLLRVRIQETAGAAGASTDDYQLQYDKNGAGYENIDTAGSAVADSYSETNSNLSINLASNETQSCGQSFTATEGDLDSAKFYLKKSGTPTGNAVARLYTHSGTFGTSSLPTGSALASSGTFDVTTLTTSNQLITFTFSGADRVHLTAGTKYIICVEYLNTASPNYVQVGSDNTSPSHAGNEVQALPLPSTWFASAARDTIFYVYTDTPAGVAVIGLNSGALSNGAVTSNRLGAGSGSFVAGEISEDGLVDDHQITASNYTEYLYAITLVAAELADADVLAFRVVRNGAAISAYTVFPNITVTQTANVTVTPSLIALVISLLTPTVATTAHVSVSPTVASLVLAGLTPTLTVGGSITLSPATASVALSAQTPTVTIPVLTAFQDDAFQADAFQVIVDTNVSVSPAIASLLLAGLTPTLVTPQTVSPSVASLILATLTPQLRSTITPTTAALLLTAATPTVTLNSIVTPAIASLVLATFAVQLREALSPSTAALALTAQTPTATVGVNLQPSIATLTLSAATSTVTATANVNVTPTIATLTLAGLAPRLDLSITPTLAALLLTAATPTVTLANIVTPSIAALVLTTLAVVLQLRVTPTTASLVLSGQTPQTNVGFNLQPTTAALLLTSVTPQTVVGTVLAPSIAALVLTSIAVTLRLQLSPANAALVLSGQTPVANVGFNLQPTAAALLLTASTPTATVSNNVTVQPSLAALILTTFAVVLQLRLTPPIASLALTGQVPNANIGINLQPTQATLTLSGATPTVVTPVSVSPAPRALVTATQTVRLDMSIPVAPKALTTSTQTSTVSFTAHYTASPSAAPLTLTGIVPDVDAGGHFTLQPDPVTLTLAGATSVITVVGHGAVGVGTQLVGGLAIGTATVGSLSAGVSSVGSATSGTALLAHISVGSSLVGGLVIGDER